MKLNKEEFLQTELGRSLKDCITAWDCFLDNLAQCGFDTPDYKATQHAADICKVEWDIYRMALKHFYGVDYHFTRTDDYFGVCTEDEKDWLFKLNRHTGKEVAVPKVAEPDVAELKVKITADTTELQEGIAELEALPLMKHEPQMPEEKKKLVNLLMDFVEDAVNPMSDEMNKCHLVGVAEILAGLVN